MANAMNDGETVRKHRESLRDCYPNMPPMKAPFVIGDIEPYQSPVDLRVINSRKDHKDDLLRNGCRVYEGRAQETQEAMRHQADNDSNMERVIGDAVEETYYDIKEKRVPPDKSGKIPFTFGI